MKDDIGAHKILICTEEVPSTNAPDAIGSLLEKILVSVMALPFFPYHFLRGNQ